MDPSESEPRLKQLMVRALSGDRPGYQALLLMSADLLRRYYRRRVFGRSADVEDLVQETLMAIHAKRASYSPALPYTAWLYGIARYKLIDFLRREGKHSSVPIHDAYDLADEADPESALAPMEIERLLASLPVKQAEALRMTHLAGLSVSEAAERSGQSESSVKVNVHRGLKKLIAIFREGR